MEIRKGREYLISASIVVHDSPVDELRRALESLSNSSADRVWVIHNGSDSRLGQEISDFRVTYRHVENHGYGAAHNVAIKEAMAAGCRYHIAMNPDIFWAGDVPGKMAEYMETHPDVALAAPDLVYPDGTFQYGARMLPTPLDLICRRLLPAPFLRRHDRRYLLQDLSEEKELNAPYLLGCCMLFRLKSLDETGLFDERFFMYPEDIDITRRLHRNWRTIRLLDVRVVHDHRLESRRSLRMLCIHILNMRRYFRKWGWFRDSERREFNRNLIERIRLKRTARKSVDE